jgi:hypothetical protein
MRVRTIKNIQPDWDLETAIVEISDRFTPGSLTSGRTRNIMLQTWGEMVGRNRAKAELDSLIRRCGSRHKFCRTYSIAPGTLATLESHFEHLPPDPEPAVGSLAAGVAVGPWMLLSRLGRGGGADVWRAFAEEHGEVALKIPRSGAYQRKRFVTECSVMRKLSGTEGVMPVIALSGSSDIRASCIP